MRAHARTLIPSTPDGAPDAVSDVAVLRAVEPRAVPVAVRAPRGWYPRIGKPVLDRVGATVLLVATAPVMASACLAVRLRLGPGVIFRQSRVGKDGVPFTILKIRTMDPDRRVAQVPLDGPDRRNTHKTDDDPRHTIVGKFLRGTSIDELPQLVNVLRGEMSLVGPRPELVQIVDKCELWDHPRHLVKPGITGVWQTSKSRCQLLHECVDMDLDYLSTMSLRTDVKLLAATVRHVVSASGW
jgi:lipopolysaccharide/colanic/teichoic acid biosynthesis glycosyltransferase